MEKDTLTYQLKHRPGTLYRDMSNVSCLQVATACNDYMNADPYANTQPEVEALWFYMSNHAVAEIRQRFEMDQPLGDHLELVNDYQNMLSEKAVRMFYYLLLICTRESRHLHSCATKTGLAKKYGVSYSLFQDKLSSKGSDGAASEFRHSPPEMEIGPYCDAMVEVFNEGSFSGGYGGKPWGNVAHCLREFVYGRYSAEMMMDTAFTLAHNNGPIFNKGMLYTTYNSSEILKILDVQRSGQIPQLVADCASVFVHEAHTEWQQKAMALLGDCMGGYVDWYMVEELGALGSYSSLKSAQVDKHGEPEAVAKAKMLAEKKKLKEEMAAAKAKAEQEANWFTVMPGVKVKKIQVRKKAA